MKFIGMQEELNLPKLGYTDIEAVLRYVFELSVNENKILVLDEYQYLRESVKGMDSILQTLLDKYKDSSKLTLIILGSYVDVMRSLLEHSNPLYGRVNLAIDLKQMDYYEASMYLNAEISKISNANEVFEALSRGYTRYSDILSQSHVSSGPTLVDVLDKLMRMEVVVKNAPINDTGNRKKAGYYISDNLSLFGSILEDDIWFNNELYN